MYLFGRKSSPRSPRTDTGRREEPRNAAQRSEYAEVDSVTNQHRGNVGRSLNEDRVNSTYAQTFQPQGQPQQYPQSQSQSYAPAPTPMQQAANGSYLRNRQSHAARTPLFRQTRPSGSRNIVIFGETGTGKSSLINMLSDEEVATTSNSAVGCTFESACYSVPINGVPYTLWDTAGLNEGDAGSVPADQALHHLRDLVDKLKDGLSLLVYCIRGSRYRDIVKVNYDLFTEIICQGEVPVVIVITGLENEANMEDWWVENKKEFEQRNLRFEGHACVTTSKGKRNMFEEEYEESKGTVRRLIQECCPDKAWVVDSNEWFNRITERIQDYYDEYNGYSGSGMMAGRGNSQQNSTSLLTLAGSILTYLGQRLMG